jgi:hypothetical protein
MNTSSSCKEFDGLVADPANVERANECLRKALLYIDKTVDPPLLCYLEPNDDYEIIGWTKESDKERPFLYRVLWTVRLKDGRTVVLDNDELQHLDVLLKVKRLLERR